MNTNPDEPAYPNAEKAYGTYQSTGGLTKREHFAALLMAGFYAAPESLIRKIGEEAMARGEKTTEETFARLAVEAADELIKALNQPRP